MKNLPLRPAPVNYIKSRLCPNIFVAAVWALISGDVRRGESANERGQFLLGSKLASCVAKSHEKLLLRRSALSGLRAKWCAKCLFGTPLWLA
jgi:hypothetical protein